MERMCRRQMKNKSMIALLVARYLNPEGNVIQLIIHGMTPIVLMQRSWAILNLDSENSKLRHLEICHDEEVIRAVSNNLK